ncbi:MAG: hypothetical protein N3G19_03930, partial [Candidatus Pacearchaeota archaeon]|nr:hypothetical protein [Candidatus Pacearchaeota archaeon]
MKDKDRYLLLKQMSREVSIDIIDKIASEIPGLNIIWIFCKAYYKGAIELRKYKVIEWIEMIMNNPKIFTEKLLS